MAYVQHHLCRVLARPPEKGGISLSTPLVEVPPLRIEENKASGNMKAFKEAWNDKNMRAALQTAGLYEAAASIFWLDPLRSSYGADTPIFDASSTTIDRFLEAMTNFITVRGIWNHKCSNTRVPKPPQVVP